MDIFNNVYNKCYPMLGVSIPLLAKLIIMLAEGLHKDCKTCVRVCEWSEQKQGSL